MTSHLSPPAVAATLAAFIDVLLPGDDAFPPASAVGAHGLVADRVRNLLGGEALADFVALLDDGQPFLDRPPHERVEVVRRLERSVPEHFDVFRTVAYYAYYQNPVVIAAIRVLGHDYNDAPQPRGYVLPPFDPTPGVDVPIAPRGWYKRTEDVARLDVSGLSVLRQDQVKEA